MEVFGPPEKHLIEKHEERSCSFDSMGKPRLTVDSRGPEATPVVKDAPASAQVR